MTQANLVTTRIRVQGTFSFGRSLRLRLDELPSGS